MSESSVQGFKHVLFWSRRVSSLNDMQCICLHMKPKLHYMYTTAWNRWTEFARQGQLLSTLVILRPATV